MDKLVVLFSGGLDSTSLLGSLVHEKEYVIPLSIDYGQRHARELRAAQEILSYYNLEDRHVVVRVPGLRDVMKGSSQTDDTVDVPEGHYADETMKLTVVPNRNMIMISIAAAVGISNKAYSILFAAHAGDHPIYPDCRPEFIYRMEQALHVASFEVIHLYAPFRHLSKSQILEFVRDKKADVPFHLTWSCYKGDSKHCGKCGTCVERKEAFVRAGITDPTVYA